MKTLSIVFIFLLTSNFLFANGGSCSNAINVNINTTTNQSLENLSGNRRNGYYYYTYYKFTPTTNGTLTITTTDMNYDSDSWLYDNLSNCQNQSDFVASDTSYKDNINITYDITKGKTYYLPIRNFVYAKDDFKLNLSLTPSISDDICYDSISVSGLNFGVVNILSKTTIPIKNISTDDLSNVQVVLASNSLFSAFSNCDILNGDGSETCSKTSDLSFFNAFTAFNSGVSYNLQTLTSNDSKSAYVESFFDFLDSNSYDLLATYTKNGTTYSGKLSQCKNDNNESSQGRPFTIRNPADTRNIRGNIKVIGNTVLCKKNRNNQCVETSDPNNDTTLSYIKEIDGFTNSSKAKIEGIPDNAEVVWAGFYAQGYTNESLETVRTDLNSQPMYLIAPDNTLYPLYPEVVDSLQWDGYTYSTFSSVNALIGKKGSKINGWWSGANIKAKEGNDNSLGYFGAWTLVVIYKDSSEDFRNITVFDGYTNISSSNNDETISLSGFLTPKSGDIDSTFSFFAGEGDVAYTGDKLYFNGTEIGNNSNIMYSHTSGYEKSPNLTNNFGIDIQNIDIGTSGANLLDHKDTSATVRFTSNGDSYYPSMFVFTTNLYTLDICYDYTYGQSGSYITAPSIKPALIDGTFNKNTPLDLKIYFRNRENSDTIINDLKVDILNLTPNAYHLNSTKTSKTDSSIININDNVLDIASDRSYVKNIPFGNFGSLDYFYLYYSLDLSQSTFTQLPIDIEFNYDLSVEGIGLGTYTTKLSEMNPCQPTPGYEPVPGMFNVIQNGQVKDLETSQPYYFNIPTQVVNRVGNFSLESMDPATDYNTTKAITKATDINITMVNMAGFHYTNATCTDPENSIVIGTPVSTHFDINDTIVSINKDLMRNAAVFSQASQNAAFRIIYTNENNISKTICSRDNFSIRPEAFKMQLIDKNATSQIQIANDGSVQHLAAGYNYNLKVNATNYTNDNPSPGYYKTFNLNSTDTAKYIWEPRNGHNVSGCNDTDDTNITKSFLNGILDDKESKVNEVGEYRLHIEDTTWTKVDYDTALMSHHTAPYFSTRNNGSTVVLDCVEDSNIAQPENSSKLNGCNISSNHTNPNTLAVYHDYNVTFHPYKFDLTGITPTVGLNDVAITPTSFVYMANINHTEDENMSVHINGNIAALAYNNSSLGNFVDSCYAVAININLATSNRALFDEKGHHVDYKIRFHNLNSTGTVLNTVVKQEDGSQDQAQNLSLSVGANNFQKNMKGKIDTQLNLNYDRKKDSAANPFNIKFINYSVNCADRTDCTFNADLNPSKTAQTSKDLNISIKHYYGRSHVQRQRYVGNEGNATITYEVFCNILNDGNKTLLQDDINSTFTDDPRWFVNTKHSNNYGKSSQIKQKGANHVNIVSGTEPTGNYPDIISLRYDEANGYPYKATMEDNASRWLIYNKYNPNAVVNEFEVEFINNSGNWAGEAETDSTTKKNAADQTNRRLMW